MKEAEKKVTLGELGEEWLKSAFDSLEATKEIISYCNQKYSFDLYNNDENLSVDQINNKQAIKETNIILPLTYTMEKFLKAVIIYYGWTTYKDDRTKAVHNILEHAKRSSNIKGNFHNILLLTEYINNQIDTHFKNFLANIYRSRREGYNKEAPRFNSSTRLLHPQERISVATEKYKNAFIELRYLYEKVDQVESVDLVKLMDFVSSIRDVSLYLIYRKKALDILNQYPSPNMNETIQDDFARSYEFVEANGCDILSDIYYCFIASRDCISEDSDLHTDEEIDDFNTLIDNFDKQIIEMIIKLEKEYKPEFTRSFNFRNQLKESLNYDKAKIKTEQIYQKDLMTNRFKELERAYERAEQNSGAAMAFAPPEAIESTIKSQEIAYNKFIDSIKVKSPEDRKSTLIMVLNSNNLTNNVKLDIAREITNMSEEHLSNQETVINQDLIDCFKELERAYERAKLNSGAAMAFAPPEAIESTIESQKTAYNKFIDAINISSPQEINSILKNVFDSDSLTDNVKLAIINRLVDIPGANTLNNETNFKI